MEWLTEEQLAAAPVRVPLADYRAWFDALDPALRAAMVRGLGRAARARCTSTATDIVLAGLRFGNLTLLIQPPRGFGENPIAIYHDPELPPSHHYLAAYRWLAVAGGRGGAPGQARHAGVAAGQGARACRPAARRTRCSATCRWSTRSSSTTRGRARRPSGARTPRSSTTWCRRWRAPTPTATWPGWSSCSTSTRPCRRSTRPSCPRCGPRSGPWSRPRSCTTTCTWRSSPAPTEFDDFVLHVDGYLCEIKDSQIRDGLHVLGAAPAGEARVNLVLAVLRARQLWGGPAPGAARVCARRWRRTSACPSRPCWPVGARVSRPGGADRPGRRPGRHLRRPGGPAGGAGPQAGGGLRDRWTGRRTRCPPWSPRCSARRSPAVVAVLRFAATEVVPRLAATTGEVDAVLHALAGGYVPAGPSGSPTRGLVNVLPTGRNFYSVDPKAIPSRNAWEVGPGARRRRCWNGTAPTPASGPRWSGLTVWGTSAMRTQGDDIAEVLALIGCRPVWDDASRRVTGFEVVPLAELGRPRIDVTVRISGFFRDAFPHVIALLDEAITAVAALDEPASANFVRAHVARRRGRARRPAAGHHPDLRLQARRVRRRAAAADRRPELARRPRPGRGVRGLGRLRLRPRAGRPAGPRRPGDGVRADGGGREERRHPRARHRRLRRLLPVPRRHGRDGAGAARREPGGLHRRLAPARAGAHPHAGGGDQAGVPGPGGQPALDRRDAPARLQGRVRAGGDGGLPVRLRRHGRAWWTTGCTSSWPRRTCSTRRCGEFLRAVQPVGAARDHGAAAGGGGPGPVGQPPPGDAGRACARRTSPSRATSKPPKTDDPPGPHRPARRAPRSPPSPSIMPAPPSIMARSRRSWSYRGGWISPCPNVRTSRRRIP